MEHKCNKEGDFVVLQNNIKQFMELLKNTNDKVEKIYEYIFEGDMESKYSTKKENNSMYILQENKNIEMQKDIEKHQDIINRLAWAVILGVVSFVGTASVLVISLLGG